MAPVAIPSGDVGKISGQLLKSNLERNGVDLAVETDLLYLNVNTGRVGINTSNPLSELEVDGTIITNTVKLDLIQINNTISAYNDLLLTTDSNTNKIHITRDALVDGTLTVGTDFVLSNGSLFTPASTVINPFPYNDYTGSVVIDGDLTVNGDVTTINSTITEFADKNIVLGSGSSDRSVADGAGITIDLGTDGVATFTYRSIDDSFVLDKPLVVSDGTIIEGDASLGNITLSGAIYGPPVLLIDPETHGDNTGTVSIVGDLIVTGTSATLNDIAVGNITSTGYLRGPANFTIDPATHGNNTGTLSIAGELIVNGTNTTLNDVSLGNITTTGLLTAPATYTITPDTGTSTPGLVTIAGDLTVSGNTIVIPDTVYGGAVITIDPATHGDNTGLVKIEGDFTVTGNTTTVNTLNSGNTTTTGFLKGPTAFSIQAGDDTPAGTVTISGDLTVTGADTEVNDLSAGNLTLSGNMATLYNFSITPADGGIVTVDGRLVVTGSSLTLAGSLKGPETFVIEPDQSSGAGIVGIDGDFAVNGETSLQELSVGNITTTGYIRGPSTLVIDPEIYGVELGLVEVEGDLNIKGNTTTVKNINTANITATGYLRGPANFTIDPAAYGDNTGTVDILGAVEIGDTLTVSGATTTVNELSSGNITTSGYLRGPTNFVIDPAAHGDDTGTVNIAGNLDVGGSTTTLNELNVGNITTSGYLRGPATLTIDPLGYGNSTGTVVIDGDLQVNGSTISSDSLGVDNLTLTGYLRGPANFTIDPATHGDNTGIVNMLGDLNVGGSTTTVNTLQSGNITTTGYLRGPTTFTIDPATHGDNTGTVVIAGNLQIDGETTTINSTTVTIDDKLIVLASGSSNQTVANGAGIQIDLGSDGTSNFTYNGIDDSFNVDRNFETFGEFRVHQSTGKDSVVIKGGTSGSSNYATTIQPQPLTANRSVSLPDADVVLVQGTMVPTTRTISLTNDSGISGATTTSLENDIDWQIGLDGQALALHNFNQTGLMVRTGLEAFAGRTIAVSGTGLSISNANGVSGNPTITSNATSTNTPSTIVSRNSSGNFSAGTITASLSGNASTATKLATLVSINGVNFTGENSIIITANTPNTLTKGSYLTGNNFNGGAATTWSVDATTTNVAGKVVARDTSGNFSAGTITASLSGNASTATKLQTSRTINGVSFNGTSNIVITSNTPNTLSRGSYLTGLSFNGSQTTTWAVDATTTNSANKVVARDASGNFSAGTITATFSSNNHLLPTADGSYDLGSSTKKWNNVYGAVFTGKSVTAQYADLAEKYVADDKYEPGTVLVFGGGAEVTTTDKHGDRRVAGVVSTNPAYVMNGDIYGVTVVAIALQGKVPCKVIGKVEKGDLLVTSDAMGIAVVDNDPKVGTVIGKALENKDTNSVKSIMVVVGRD